MFFYNSSDAITLHVHTPNTSALDFYKKFGFEIVATDEKYYETSEHLEVKSAYKLELKAAKLLADKKDA